MFNTAYCKDVLKNHVCYMSISGEPHIDGDPGDLRFKIKQQKYVILKVFYIFSLENEYVFKGSKSAILIFAYLLDKGQLLKVSFLLPLCLRRTGFKAGPEHFFFLFFFSFLSFFSCFYKSVTET